MAGDYLLLRDGVYYFKRHVPLKLVPLIGKTVWRETLKVSTRPEAIEAAEPLIETTNAQIRHAMTEFRRRQRAEILLTPKEFATLAEHGGFGGLRRETKALTTTIAFATAAAEMLDASPETAREIGASTDELAANLAEAEARVRQLREQFERNQVILAKGGREPAERAVTILPSTDIDMAGLAERYVANLTKQHADQYRYPARLFVEFHGTMPIALVTKAHVRDWRDALSRMPRSTASAYRTASMPRAIAMADKAGTISRVTANTAAKHLAAIKTLLKFAVKEGYLDRNVAEGMDYPLPQVKKSAQDRRDAFTPAQIRTLFDSLETEYGLEKDEFWLPLVALYQGMRLEEVCQLFKTDITFDSGVNTWLISVTDAGDDQKVKNTASVRTVPMHPALIKRGFLDHVNRSPGKQVFSSLKPDKRGRLGGPYGKRFRHHLRARAKITERSLVFHSLRHTWRTAARAAEVPMEVALRLGGWTEGGNAVASGYGRDALAIWAKWIGRIDPFMAVGQALEV